MTGPLVIVLGATGATDAVVRLRHTLNAPVVVIEGAINVCAVARALDTSSRFRDEDLGGLARAIEAQRELVELARRFDRDFADLPDPRDLLVASAGVGRLRHAFDLMPAPWLSLRVERPRTPRGPDARRVVRRDRWPGGERRRNPRATFRARWCAHRRRP